MEEFEAECFLDPLRFEKPIKRKKIRNFSMSIARKKSDHKDIKCKELVCSRDFFGCLLFLATEKNLDLKYVLQFPPVPLPLCLAHMDGTIMKTDMMRNLESKVKSGAPQTIDATIIEAMFLIQSLINMPTTFGGIAKLLMRLLVFVSPTVHCGHI
jgi:hypothetical protein